MTDSIGERVPSYLDLMKPIFAAIRQLGGSATNREIVNQVIEDMGLSDDIVQVQSRGKAKMTALEYGLTWARTYLKKYGLIDNSERGVWSLTAKGLQTQDVDPQAVDEAVRDFYLSQKRTPEQTETEEGTLAEEIEISAEKPTAWRKELLDALRNPTAWRKELLDALRNMPPDAFERLCRRLLRESGFTEVVVTGKPSDGGIDGHGIIHLAGGLLSFPVVFQCKRYSGSVGASVVRDFSGAMGGRAKKGLILTTGRFTAEAQREAIRNSEQTIDLIDGELLIDKMKELELGVSVSAKMVEVVEVKKDWFASI